MALVNQPPILASSFAVNGDKNTIPATNSGTEGLASLSLGFPPITQQPVSQGGIPPQRADFNGIFNLITNFLMFIQNGSIFAYSSSLDYQPPAIVYGNNALYRCVATNGANTSAGVQPLSNTDYWKPLIPVGAITISGNTITVTNETGEQIQYTIDTINNPPVQSDSSNKIVTSAWVKAYAPSKTGSGASGTWGININGNAGTSTKATQDSQGQQINTTYIKGVSANNATLTITKGNGTTSQVTVNNVANATAASKVVQGTQYYLQSGDGDVDENTVISQNKANVVLGSWYSTGFRDLATKGRPIHVAINHRNGNIKTLGSVTASGGFKGNADSATKATQDSRGQQINTTYVKSVTGSNATLTITKGNGTTSSVTVNNVSHATSADSSTNTGNFNQGFETNNENFPASTFRQTILGRANKGICARPFCGKLPNNTEISNPGMAFGGLDTHGFLQLRFDSNNPAAYVGAGNNNRINWYKKLAFTDSPGFSGSPTAPTQGTSDNSNKIATTAFVKSLFTASKATNGWHKEASTGLIWQWGTVQGVGGGKLYNFPISFPNAVLGCASNKANRSGYGAVDGNSAGIVINNKSSFYAYDDDGRNNVNYIAVGY